MKISLHLLIVLSILLLSPLSNITAENIKFIDLDGDGLDDNLGDKNSDGIPDFTDEKADNTDAAAVTGGSGIFSSMPIADVAEVDVTEITPCSEMFGQYSFSTRNLSTNRGGFSSSDGFGPENGLSGSSFGGVCVGPLCH